MKSLIAASAFTTGGFVFSLLVAAGTVEGIVYAQSVGAVGAETPVSGITLGILGVGAVVSFGLLWRGAKSMIQLGGYLGELKQAVKNGARTVTLLAELNDRMEAMERWKSEVDPFISEALRTRLGLDQNRKLPGA